MAPLTGRGRISHSAELCKTRPALERLGTPPLIWDLFSTPHLANPSRLIQPTCAYRRSRGRSFVKPLGRRRRLHKQGSTASARCPKSRSERRPTAVYQSVFFSHLSGQDADVGSRSY